MTEKVLRDVSSEREVEVLRTDAVVAKELREQLTGPLEEICRILTKARAEGYGAAWNLQVDSFGKNMRVIEIMVQKTL